MARLFAKPFYNSKAWKQSRATYIALKFGICERCGSPNSKQVHHKILLTPDNINDPDVSLSFTNLELLCDICHQLEHNTKYSATAPGTKFDENGQLVRIAPRSRTENTNSPRPHPKIQRKYV